MSHPLFSSISTMILGGFLSCYCPFVAAQSSKFSPNLSASRTDPDVILAAVVKRFAKVLKFRFDAPEVISGQPRLPVVVLTGKAVGALDKFSRFEEFEVLTEQELVAKQIASFILISQIVVVGDDVMVAYESPGNASYGSLRVSSGPDALRVEGVDTFRSSSGARFTYGQLYQKAVCRNGMEMAYRWNYYSDDKVSGICPGPTFADAQEYLRDSNRRSSKP